MAANGGCLTVLENVDCRRSPNRLTIVCSRQVFDQGDLHPMGPDSITSKHHLNVDTPMLTGQGPIERTSCHKPGRSGRKHGGLSAESGAVIWRWGTS